MVVVVSVRVGEAVHLEVEAAVLAGLDRDALGKIGVPAAPAPGRLVKRYIPGSCGLVVARMDALPTARAAELREHHCLRLRLLHGNRRNVRRRAAPRRDRDGRDLLLRLRVRPLADHVLVALAVLPADDLLPALLVHVDGGPVIVDYAVRGRGRVGEVEERRTRIDRNSLHGLLDLDNVLKLVLVETDEVEAHSAPVGDAPRNLEAGVLDIGEFVEAHEHHAVRVDIEHRHTRGALGLLALDLGLPKGQPLLGGQSGVPHHVLRARILCEHVRRIAVDVEVRAAIQDERVVAVGVGP